MLSGKDERAPPALFWLQLELLNSGFELELELEVRLIRAGEQQRRNSSPPVYLPLSARFGGGGGGGGNQTQTETQTELISCLCCGVCNPMSASAQMAANAPPDRCRTHTHAHTESLAAEAKACKLKHRRALKAPWRLYRA